MRPWLKGWRLLGLMFGFAWIINTLAGAMFYGGLYEPQSPYGTEYYPPYLLLSGPGWLIAMPAAAGLDHALRPLLGPLPPDVRYIWLSGVANAAIGAMEAYLVVALYFRARSVDSQVTSGPESSLASLAGAALLFLGVSPPGLTLAGLAAWLAESARQWKGLVHYLHQVGPVSVPPAAAFTAFTLYLLFLGFLSVRSQPSGDS